MAINVPVGAARTIGQVIADPLLARRGTLRRDDGVPVIGRAVHVRDDAMAPAAQRPATAAGGAAPLAGVRVVEITRFTAGPIAGLVLAGLGAEVIKIESPGGEESRKWTPRFGAVSGYFANYNAGKRSVVLDLRQAEGRRGLEALVADADVLLQNVRPGVMDEIGLGAEAATRRHQRLVYASLNGYGLDGPKLAALDTVIQAEYGLTTLIGDGNVPCRMGFSIADQLAGHITALGILAAIARRDVTGRGGIVDTAMGDAIAWLTQLAWPEGHGAIGACSRWTASDGWIVAATDAETARAALGDGAGAARADMVARLAQRGILAAPVLEPHEVFGQPVIQRRRSVYEIATQGGGRARVLVPPLGLTGTPVLRPPRLADLGEDGAALLGIASEGAS
jgi:crotonobetainyl-CoA:carnitine CoA-transferase CaiB-like acyl-CoA transferase